MSGVLSDMLTASLAKHSRTLTENRYFNGHPDLIVQGVYPDNAVKAGTKGIEIKTTRKSGGAVDTHGARDQWMCVFVYDTDKESEPAQARRSMTFTEIYLGKVTTDDFRKILAASLEPVLRPFTRTASRSSERIGFIDFKLRAVWLVARELEYSLTCHVEVMTVLLHANALVPNSLRSRQSRTGSSEWIEDDSFAKRQNSTHNLP